jgi:Myb-like DNA-binding domain
MKRRSDDAKKTKAVWTPDEDEALLKAVKDDQKDREVEGDAEDEEDWDEIAKSVPGKTPVQCLKRYMLLNNTKKTSAPTAETEAEEDSKPAAKESRKPIADDSATEGGNKKKDDSEDDEDDDDQEREDESGERPSKITRTEGGDASPSWSQEELDLLKKLVEQYKESKYFHTPDQVRLSQRSPLLILFGSRRCSSME